MSDGEEKADTWHNCDDKQHLEKEIDKEKQKLKYFLDETDKLIKLRDYTERILPTDEWRKSWASYWI